MLLLFVSGGEGVKVGPVVFGHVTVPVFPLTIEKRNLTF